MDALNAALVNGISSHVLDFDDTHAETGIHPAAPIAPAILALAEQQPVAGPDLIAALVVGVETECRIGKAVSPSHYEIGWHITGTAGVFGSAAANGRLLGLDERQMAWALGLAAAQPFGLQEMFGSMTKSFHPGKAAQNGLTAALFAKHGYTASEHALEAKRGWLTMLSAARNYAAFTNESWDILANSYKPFACGLVVHPVINGCIELRNRNHLDPDMIERVEVGVNPRVMLVTAIQDPKTGLEGKFSVHHAAAVALIDGRRSEHRQGAGTRRDRAQKRRTADPVRRARRRQPAEAAERPRHRGQVPRPRRRRPAQPTGRRDHRPVLARRHSRRCRRHRPQGGKGLTGISATLSLGCRISERRPRAPTPHVRGEGRREGAVSRV
jgi:2-methylcitrate dehydratase PrpD